MAFRVFHRAWCCISVNGGIQLQLPHVHNAVRRGQPWGQLHQTPELCVA